MLVGAEVDLPDGEEAHALVEAARHHRVVRQPDDAPVREHALGGAQIVGDVAARTAAATLTAGRDRHARLRGLDLDVVGEGERALDEGALRVDVAADGLDLGDRRREEARDVDHGRAVGAVGLDVEDGDDRRIVGRLDRVVHRERRVGHDAKGGRAQHDAVAHAIPAQRALGELVAAVAREAAGARGVGGRGARVAADEQLVAIELLRGDLEVELVAHAVHDEHAALGDGLLRDHLRVGARLGFARAAGAAVSVLRALRGGGTGRACGTGLLRGLARLRATGEGERDEDDCGSRRHEHAGGGGWMDGAHQLGGPRRRWPVTQLYGGASETAERCAVKGREGRSGDESVSRPVWDAASRTPIE